MSESWGSGYTFTREAVAVADKTFTDSDGTSRDGYVVAIKNTFKDGSETHIDWQLDYVKPDGVIDEGKTEHKFSIKNDEAAFGMDLDGDEKEGFDVTDLEAVATDEVGDLLKKDGYAYYILDDNDTSTKSDDKTIALVDSWGDSPYFDYEWSYGSGDNAYFEKVSTFAVESFTEKGVKKFMLAVKREEQYGTADKETFWETFKIVESSPGAGIGLWTGQQVPTPRACAGWKVLSIWISTAITSLILGRLQQPTSQRIPVALAWLG